MTAFLVARSGFVAVTKQVRNSDLAVRFQGKSRIGWYIQIIDVNVNDQPEMATHILPVRGDEIRLLPEESRIF
ncbi:hypothetical protein ACLBWX_16900 [Methylobacterium sp. M6A4_1b]